MYFALRGNPPGNFRSFRFAWGRAFIECAGEERTCAPQEKHYLRAAVVENQIGNADFAPKADPRCVAAPEECSFFVPRCL
jgi:hypothetical protein